jgi:hypothetical protein
MERKDDLTVVGLKKWAVFFIVYFRVMARQQDENNKN